VWCPGSVADGEDGDGGGERDGGDDAEAADQAADHLERDQFRGHSVCSGDGADREDHQGRQGGAGGWRIRGKGRKQRSIPVHAELGAALDTWLTERRTWPGADTNPAVFPQPGRGPVVGNGRPTRSSPVSPAPPAWKT
jgi:hypothetical protein